LDILNSITELKKEKNAIILAHYYQLPEVQEVADFVGDSLDLSQKAAQTDAEIIVFAGVHFMAETAKILNPTKKVLVPDLDAGCSLADSCPADKLNEFINKNPGHIVVSYINCSVDVKAISDIICTSTNALQIIESIPKDKSIIFAPDKNLGKYLEIKSGREMLKWEGTCIVHQEFSAERIKEIKQKYPEIKVIAHPECSSYMLEHADFVGSTSALLNFSKTDSSLNYIVATETGLIYQMKKANPEKKFIPAPVSGSCVACQECPYMKKNTIKKVLDCLKDEKPELLMEESLRIKALTAVENMLKFGVKK
jgi:quinolinate synthase